MRHPTSPIHSSFWARRGHLETDLVERLENMARFRNLLVHGYAIVDDARVVEILKTRLHDLDEFRQSVARAGPD